MNWIHTRITRSIAAEDGYTFLVTEHRSQRHGIARTTLEIFGVSNGRRLINRECESYDHAIVEVDAWLKERRAVQERDPVQPSEHAT